MRPVGGGGEVVEGRVGGMRVCGGGAWGRSVVGGVVGLTLLRWATVGCGVECVSVGGGVGGAGGGSMGGMGVDGKLRASLDAGKALGRTAGELRTPAEARAEGAEMVAQFVAIPEYAGVRGEARGIFAGGRES